MNPFKDLMMIFFPNLCPACNEAMVKGESFICSGCLSEMPFHDFSYESNLRSKLMGRLDVEHAYIFLKFTKGGIVQRLLHHLKYKGRMDIGIQLGEQFGKRLQRKGLLQETDYIVPVPLHKTKKRKRGFNQSEIFGKGLSEGLGVKLLPEALLRIEKGKSQTTKTRGERLKSVMDSYKVNKTFESELTEKHILLIDDVFTTGATLEACGTALLNAGIKSLSLATIADA